MTVLDNNWFRCRTQYTSTAPPILLSQCLTFVVSTCAAASPVVMGSRGEVMEARGDGEITVEMYGLIFISLR